MRSSPCGIDRFGTAGKNNSDSETSDGHVIITGGTTVGEAASDEGVGVFHKGNGEVTDENIANINRDNDKPDPVNRKVSNKHNKSRRSRKRPGLTNDWNKTVEIKLLAANCRSLANKLASIMQILEVENIDVAVLSEVNLKKTVPQIKGFRAFTNLSQRRFHGVAVYMANSFSSTP